MNRVLKNTANVWVEKNVLGKIYKIKPKGSLTIVDSQSDQVADDLLQTYGFLKDITPKEAHPAPQTDEEVKKVVKPAVKKKAPKRHGISRRGKRSS